MPIFGIHHCFANGVMKKDAIVYIEAENEERALKAFGLGKFWQGYSENAAFDVQEVTECPRDRLVSVHDILEEDLFSNMTHGDMSSLLTKLHELIVQTDESDGDAYSDAVWNARQLLTKSISE